MNLAENYSLMLHGGAGALDHLTSGKDHVRYLESIRIILEYGREILSRGGSALEAVESCASLLEDDPLFNAGCGSVLNEYGRVEMDAGIMDGRNLAAGAVAGVHNIANPILLARLVLARSEHVMLVGEGAMRFAEHCGMQQAPDKYFVTEERLAQYREAHALGDIVLDHDQVVGHLERDVLNLPEVDKYGTIGAVAWDRFGNLAAATSTGGIVNKRHGRVGDSPIIGAGLYADNATCAVSATGYGEDFMRTVLAKTVADVVDYLGHDALRAAEAGIEYLVRKVNGRGGIIVIDKDGNCASRFTTKRMIHGWIEKGGKSVCTF